MSSQLKLKQLSRECQAAAAERLAANEQQDEDDQVAILSAIAQAAISKLSDLVGDSEATHELRRELKRIAKSVARLEPQINEALSAANNNSSDQNGEEDDAAQKAADEEVDLGQYAHTEVFEGDDKKKNKFARLMGGAKKVARHDEGEDHHTTFALPAKEQKKLDSEIEREFDAARTHHGKKGLGAK